MQVQFMKFITYVVWYKLILPAVEGKKIHQVKLGFSMQFSIVKILNCEILHCAILHCVK